MLLAWATEPTLARRTLLVVMTLPIAVFMNGLSVAATGVFAEAAGRPPGAELHAFMGWITFLVAVVALMALQRLPLGRIDRARASPGRARRRNGMSESRGVVLRLDPRRRGTCWRGPRNRGLAGRVRDGGTAVCDGDWQGVDDRSLDAATAAQLGADAYLTRTYSAQRGLTSDCMSRTTPASARASASTRRCTACQARAGSRSR